MGLGGDIRKHRGHAMQNVDKAIRGTVEEGGERLIAISPVGDPALWKRPPPPGYVGGRFRSNWNYSVDHIDTSTTELVTIKVVNGLDAMPATLWGRKHNISNSLPYARPLEYGHSTQAPHPPGIIGVLAIEAKGIGEEQARKAASA